MNNLFNQQAKHRIDDNIASALVAKKIADALKTDGSFSTTRIVVMSNGRIVVAQLDEKQIGIVMSAFTRCDFEVSDDYVGVVKAGLSHENAIVFGADFRTAFEESQLTIVDHFQMFFSIAFVGTPIFQINVKAD